MQKNAYYHFLPDFLAILYMKICNGICGNADLWNSDKFKTQVTFEECKLNQYFVIEDTYALSWILQYALYIKGIPLEIFRALFA